MAETRARRRLVAILAADVVGYSRLMRADEAGTLARLKSLRQDILDPTTEDYGGRVVKTAGDGILIEFSSAVDAVQHAVHVQRELARRNADVPQDRRMEMRMGINVGDVIVEGDDIFGDGVNVAARLEGLAEAGGICVSGSTYEQVRHKLDLAFEDIGAQSVKNIDEPVQTYRLSLDGAEHPAAPIPAAAASKILERPAVAVLPFDNMSGDAEQEYFADGITEDIITELSKSGWFPVIARNSTFAYKGTSPDVRRLAEELGAGYVVEGSVRKGGNRVRITAQLIDAGTGHHIWAERYDRDLEDVFAVQDEITMSLAGAIMPEVSTAAQKLALRKPPESLEAWDLFLRAQWLHSRFTHDDLVQARQLLLDAVQKDPQMAMAHAKISDIALWMMVMGWHDSPEIGLREATEHATRALALDGGNAHAHACMAWCVFYTGQLDEARREGETAIALNPSYAIGRIYVGNLFVFLGLLDDAIEQFDVMRKLSPRDPLMFVTDSFDGLARYMQGNDDDAIVRSRRAIKQNPDFLYPYFTVAAACGRLGRRDEADRALADARPLVPDQPKEFFMGAWPFADPADMEVFLDGLRKAGAEGI
jgi:adenylate cyclase